MILRCTKFGLKFNLTISRVARVIGVNSEVGDGRHILMWDFDNVPLEYVKTDLLRIQARYSLSDIHILRTKEPDNYIAYCFTTQSWRSTVEIVAQSFYLDWQFFRFGVFREKFTLRVTPKGERIPYLVERLEGYCLPDVKPSDLASWVRYETLNWR